MRIREWQENVVFLHEVVGGTADRSYGVHVGRLAGLPAPVIARAEEVLALLEEGDQGLAIERLVQDLPLFAAATPPTETPRSKPVNAVTEPRSNADALVDAVGKLRPDELSPKEALDAVYTLKALLEAAPGPHDPGSEDHRTTEPPDGL